MNKLAPGNQNINYSLEFFVLVAVLSNYKRCIKLKRYINKTMYPLDKHGENCKCSSCDTQLRKYYDTWVRIK